MSVFQKMMAIAGRTSDKKARAVKVNNEGEILTRVRGGHSEYFSATERVEGEHTIMFPKPMSSLLVINKSDKDISFSLQGKNKFGEIEDNTSPSFSYTGTWVTQNGKPAAIGGTWRNSNTIGSVATYKPNVDTDALHLHMISATSAGVLKVEVSADNGMNWVAPSTVSGIKSTTGKTGTSLDKFDGFGANNTRIQLGLILPYKAKWAIRVTLLDEKNPSSSGLFTFIDAGSYGGIGNIVDLDAGSSIDLPIQTDRITIHSEELSTIQVVAVG